MNKAYIVITREQEDCLGIFTTPMDLHIDVRKYILKLPDKSEFHISHNIIKPTNKQIKEIKKSLSDGSLMLIMDEIILGITRTLDFINEKIKEEVVPETNNIFMIDCHLDENNRISNISPVFVGNISEDSLEDGITMEDAFDNGYDIIVRGYFENKMFVPSKEFKNIEKNIDLNKLVKESPGKGSTKHEVIFEEEETPDNIIYQ